VGPAVLVLFAGVGSLEDEDTVAVLESVPGVVGALMVSVMTGAAPTARVGVSAGDSARDVIADPAGAGGADERRAGRQDVDDRDARGGAGAGIRDGDVVAVGEAAEGRGAVAGL